MPADSSFCSFAPLLFQGAAAPQCRTGRTGQDRTGRTGQGGPSSCCSAPFPTSRLGISLPPLTAHVLQEHSTEIHTYWDAFQWASCSGGGNQTIYQQFSSSTNHSPVKKFYWSQQFKSFAWIQRVKILLLSPLFPCAGKNPHHPPHQKPGMRRREGGKTNKYIGTGHSEVGPSVLIIYYIFCQSEYWSQFVAQGEHLKIHLLCTYSIFLCPLQKYSILKEAYLKRQAQSLIQTQCNCNSSLVFIINFLEKKIILL